MVISSTIDKIKDTTIMRSLRKLAGLMDEQNASIDAVNERLDNFDLSGVESDIATLKTDVSQVEISVGENTEHLKTVDSTLNNHATEISGIKAKDVSQDSEIQGLNESVVSDLTGEFNNDTRTLKLSVERESAPSIDCSVVIPAGGSTGNYTGGTGIDINSNNVVSAKIDNSTIKINSSGQMYSVGGGSGGKVYSAGNGIDISDSDVISVTNELLTSVRDGVKEITYNADYGTFTYKSTGGQENIITIPTIDNFEYINNPGLLGVILGSNLQSLAAAGEVGYYSFIEIPDFDMPALVPCVDGTTIHFNSDNELEVIGGGSSSPAKFNRQFFSFETPSNIFSKLVDLELGTFVSINSMGKTSSSWSGTISGILLSKTTDRVFFVTVGCAIWNGSDVIPAGATNYNIPPQFSVDSSDLNIPVQKGNSVQGLSLLWQESQGCSVTIFN